MAYDIGPRIGIDGEREFRQQLQSVSTQLKTLSSEMKVVTTAFADNENSMEALTAKNEVLTKTIDALNDKMAQQRCFHELAREKFGDSADETLKWERALNESQAQLNQLQNELRQNERRLESFGDEAKEAGDAMDEAGRSALDFGDALKASFVGNLAAEGAKALFSALVELGGAMGNLDEETAEFRQQQSMLNAAFKENGFEAEPIGEIDDLSKSRSVLIFIVLFIFSALFNASTNCIVVETSIGRLFNFSQPLSFPKRKFARRIPTRKITAITIVIFVKNLLISRFLFLLYSSWRAFARFAFFWRKSSRFKSSILASSLLT